MNLRRYSRCRYSNFSLAHFEGLLVPLGLELRQDALARPSAVAKLAIGDLERLIVGQAQEIGILDWHRTEGNTAKFLRYGRPFPFEQTRRALYSGYT
jgi:hypothetical protein